MPVWQHRTWTCWQRIGLSPGTLQPLQEPESHVLEGMLTELGWCMCKFVLLTLILAKPCCGACFWQSLAVGLASGKALLWTLLLAKPCCGACLPTSLLCLPQAML